MSGDHDPWWLSERKLKFAELRDAAMCNCACGRREPAVVNSKTGEHYRACLTCRLGYKARRDRDRELARAEKKAAASASRGCCSRAESEVAAELLRAWMGAQGNSQYAEWINAYLPPCVNSNCCAARCSKFYKSALFEFQTLSNNRAFTQWLTSHVVTTEQKAG